MKKINVYKQTQDDWYPSYKLTNNVELVRVSFTTTGPNPPVIGEWRVYILKAIITERELIKESL